jgi:predicted DNA-binding WGR domain protein
MTRADPKKNMARWYEIDVEPTLFGECTFERHWGRIGSAGQSKTFWFDHEGTTDRMASQLSNAKARRGCISPTPLPVDDNLR